MSKTTILFILLLLTITFPVILYPDFMGDDTFIHLCFAKSLVNDGIWSYNHNVTYGSTSPLWTMLVALLWKTHLFQPEHIIRFLSLASSVLCSLLIWKSAEKHFSTFITSILVILWIVNSTSLRWAYTGMEAALAAALFLYLNLSFESLKNKFSPIIAFIWGVTPLIRPEFYLFLLIYSLFLIRPLLIFGKNKTWLFFYAFLIVLPSLIWGFYAYHQFGTIIPNTFYHKAGNSLLQGDFSNLIKSLMTLFSVQGVEMLIMSVLVAILWKMKKLNEFLDLNIFAPLLCLLGFYGYYLLKDVLIVSRYAVMFVPILLIVLARVGDLYGALSKKIILGILLLYVSVHFTLTFAFIRPEAQRFSAGFQTKYKEIAQFLKAEKAKSIALSDVGIIGLYTDANIYDLVGLTDHRRFNFKNKKLYIAHFQPEYILCREEFNPIEVMDTTQYKAVYQTEIASMGLRNQATKVVRVYKKIK